MNNIKTRPLRVALITSTYNFYADGVALVLNRLVGWLISHGVMVKVFGPTTNKPVLKHEGDLISVPSLPMLGRPEYRQTFGLGGKAKKILLEFKPDLIHVAAPDLLGIAAVRLAKKLNIPVVATYHTRFEMGMQRYWFWPGLKNFITRYLRWFYGQFDEVYLPSQCMHEVLLAEGYRDNFKLWLHGVDTVHFSPEKRSEAWREQYGIRKEEIVVVWVSRLVREKRLDTLTEVMNLMDLPHRLVIVGDGRDRNFVENRLPHAIFTGFLSGEELAKAYASSDVYFFPSDSETFGLVTLEAMASGLACVCANATGSRSLIIPDECGYLLSPDDVNGFTKAITQLIGDASLRQRMGLASRKRSLNYSWDAVMQQILDYYHRLVESYKG